MRAYFFVLSYFLMVLSVPILTFTHLFNFEILFGLLAVVCLAPIVFSYTQEDLK